MNLTTALLTGADNDDTSAIVQTFSFISATRLGPLAILTVMVYDIIISMDDEVHYFWVLPCNSVNSVFFLIRYSAIIRAALAIWQYGLHNSIQMCFSTGLGIDILDWLILTCMDYILYLRVRALYSLDFEDKKIVRCLRLLFVFESAITLSISIHLGITTKVFPYVFAGEISLCSGNLPNVAEKSVIWGTILAYQLILIALSLSKSRRLFQTLGLRGARLVRILVQDQAIYLVLILIYSITNLIGAFKWTVPEWVKIYYTVFGGASVLAPLGSRMLVHLKKAAENNPREGGSLRIPTHASTAAFRTISTRRSSIH